MSGICDEFSGSLTADVLELNLDAIPAPDTLVIRMTRGERRIADELRKSFGRFERVVIDVDGEQHEYDADALIALLESYEQVPEQGERENEGERESYAPPLDVLLRCLENDYGIRASWDRLRRVWLTESVTAKLDCIENKSRWHELFGTPERMAETLMDMCQSMGDCGHCSLYLSGLAFCDNGDYEGDVLEWLRGDAE